MTVVMPRLERRLKAGLSGEVQFDRFSRGRYATDASHYQMMPVGVVAPRTIEEAERAIAVARAERQHVFRQRPQRRIGWNLRKVRADLAEMGERAIG